MAVRGPPGSGMNSEVMRMQEQIRRNALETSESMKELGTWQKDIRKTDKKLAKLHTSGPGKVVPVRVRGGTVRVSSSGGRVAPRNDGASGSKATGAAAAAARPKRSAAEAEAKVQRRAARAARRAAAAAAAAERAASRAADKKAQAAAHVYDKGYDKWQKFDVDKALAESSSDDEGVVVDDGSSSSSSSSDDDEAGGGSSGGSGGPALHPALMHAPAKVVQSLKRGKAVKGAPPVVSAGPPQAAGDRERYEREVGNAAYKAGDFAEAVKHYTRCIAINPRNVLALSNRAMAFLKTKQHLKAERDCSAALRVDPAHVKSLTRRATARNDMGRHHHALADYQAAAELDPSSKLIRSELRKTTDRLRSTLRNAPRRALALDAVRTGEEVRPEVAGPLGPNALTRPRGLPAAAPKPPPAEEEQEQEQQQGGEKEEGTDKERAGQGGTVSPAPKKGSKSQELAAESEPPSAPVEKVVEVVKVAEQAPATAKAKVRMVIDEDSGDEDVAAAAPAPAAAPRRVISPAKTVAYAGELVAPKTSYEFQRVWRELAGEARAEQRAAYLALLKPSALPKLLGDALDAPLLCGIVDGAVAAYLPEGGGAASAPKKALRVLEKLAKVNRFSMTTMFLAAEEKATIVAAFDALAAASAEGEAAEAVRALRVKYGV